MVTIITGITFPTFSKGVQLSHYTGHPMVCYLYTGHREDAGKWSLRLSETSDEECGVNYYYIVLLFMNDVWRSLISLNVT